jgi:magnesium chelatase accessory protein
MDWAKDGGDWPNREHSVFVEVRPHRWHLQVAGDGPDLLLLHGSGGATQSLRAILPLLAQNWRVIAPDLPGQGFTRQGARQRLGLDMMATDLWALLDHLEYAPSVAVGHSAGAAIALRMSELRSYHGVVGINAALGAFDGIAGWLFPIMAKMLALNPIVPPLFARTARSEKRVRELIASTGSRIDERGMALYRRLIGDVKHVDGTLSMMAQWRLDGLVSRLPSNRVPTLFLVGARDGTVPPEVSRRAAERMPNARVECLGPYGHLVHEEAPELVAGRVTEFLRPLAVRS